MKKLEFVYRELLFNVIEKKQREFKQLELSKKLNLSLSTVNLAIKPLRDMASIKVRLKGFSVIDPKKLLYYWASIRNLKKDIIYKTKVNLDVKTIEANMPDDIIFSCYSGYKFKFKDVPADYSEVYVYADSIEKRFPFNEGHPNLFVFKKDPLIEGYGKTATNAQLFVDLWNLEEWYAKEFLKALEDKIDRILE